MTYDITMRCLILALTKDFHSHERIKKIGSRRNLKILYDSYDIIDVHTYDGFVL